jgi:Ca-activated chloride channel family protein
MRTRVAVSMLVVFLSCLVASGFSRKIDARKIDVRKIDRGTLAGTITDAAGAPLPGVALALTGPERRRAVTDARGAFAFTSLLPGAYELRAERAGYIAVMTRVTLGEGQTERVSLRLQPLARTEPLIVSTPASAAAARDASDGVAGGVVDGLPHAGYLPGRYSGPFHTEAYDHLDENPFRQVATDPLSTFSVDVDTASYANVRRFLSEGKMPPPGAVRIEELVNYFRFDYPQPRGDAPFSIATELTACPWTPAHRLALVGLQGRDLDEREPAPRNLVFLIDVSGSMQPPGKLPLVRTAMRMLADALTSADRVAIVVYAGASGLVLPSTPGDRKSMIHRAIAELEAGGSTNGGAGITLAYQIAREHFMPGGVNRVVLATDGDFNVGVTGQDELVRLIGEQRESGVFLSVLGVGTGNLKDSTMEKLADKGNGNYSYLDSLHEARKVLVREAGGTLVTIAKDVKIQVEFNPRLVSAYRLIGYENRVLRHDEFNDDTKDAGEIGAGHSVTALYEIVPADVGTDAPEVDPLKYQQRAGPTPAATSDELVTVKLRYKAPDGNASRLLTTVIHDQPRAATPNIGFASAVAEFGMLLRGSRHAGRGSYQAVIARARTFRGADREGYRAEFIKLADLAAGLLRITSESARR